MDKFVYFDIETIPTQDSATASRLVSEARPPARMSKPDTIAKWREDGADDIVAKTSFDGGRGHVCCIAWAHNDDQPIMAVASDVEQESDIIRTFFEALGKYHSTTLVGHYISGFDIPFLTKRAIVLGLRLPPSNVWPRDPRPWGKNIADTMHMWAGHSGRVSMNSLCDIFGIDGKGGLDGSMVADAWRSGEYEKIANYCVDDVVRSREIHQRFLAAGW